MGHRPPPRSGRLEARRPVVHGHGLPDARLPAAAAGSCRSRASRATRARSSASPPRAPSRGRSAPGSHAPVQSWSLADGTGSTIVARAESAAVTANGRFLVAVTDSARNGSLRLDLETGDVKGIRGVNRNERLVGGGVTEPSGHRGPRRRGRPREPTAPSPIPSAPPARRCCRECSSLRHRRRWRLSPPEPSEERRPSPTARIPCSGAGRAGTRTRSSATSGIRPASRRRGPRPRSTPPPRMSPRAAARGRRSSSASPTPAARSTTGSMVPCSSYGIACMNRTGVPDSFAGMWFRPHGWQFDWGTLKWCQALAAFANGCYDVENVALDEFGHMELLGHHVNYEMRATSPTPSCSSPPAAGRRRAGTSTSSGAATSPGSSSSTSASRRRTRSRAA